MAVDEEDLLYQEEYAAQPQKTIQPQKQLPKPKQDKAAEPPRDDYIPQEPVRVEMDSHLENNNFREIMVSPHDSNAERSILGSVLIDASCMDLVFSSISENDFYVPAHATMFSAMKALHSKQYPIDLVTMTAALESNQSLDLCGGMNYILDLITFVPTAANVSHYINIVLSYSSRRTFISEMQRAITEAIADGVDYMKLAGCAIEMTGKKSMNPVSRIGSNAISIATSVGDQKTNTNVFPTGLSSLDRQLNGGFRRGEVIVVGARPNHGKSTMSLGFIRTFCKNQNVAYLASMDDSLEKCILRLVTAESCVSIPEALRFANDKNGKEFILEFMEAACRIAEWPLYIKDKSTVSIDEIKSDCIHILAREHKLDLVVIDYIGQMDVSSTGKQRQRTRAEEIANVSSKLKMMAKDLDCVVIVVAQFNRVIEGQHDKRPQLSYLKDSGGIEADANIVLFPYLPYKDDPAEDHTKALVYVAKSKDSDTGVIDTISFDGEHFTFYEGQKPTCHDRKWRDVGHENIPEEFK